MSTTITDPICQQWETETLNSTFSHDEVARIWGPITPTPDGLIDTMGRTWRPVKSPTNPTPTPISPTRRRIEATKALLDAAADLCAANAAPPALSTALTAGDYVRAVDALVKAALAMGGES